MKKLESLNSSKFENFKKNELANYLLINGGTHWTRTQFERATCTENDLWYKCSTEGKYDNGYNDWKWLA